MRERAEDSMDPAVAANSRPLPLPVPKRNRHVLLFGLFVVTVLLFTVAVNALFQADQETRQRRVARENLYRAVTNAVSVRLKGPRSALFCSMAEMLEENGEARGCVDSQNDFGAMIRTKIMVLYRPGGGEDSFVVQSVQFPKRAEQKAVRVEDRPIGSWE